MKEEGNQCFENGSYGDALGKYFHALKLCHEHGLKTEGARIRSNCALACMKMEMYDDAFTHCTECIQLDPKFDKVNVCVHVYFSFYATMISVTHKVATPVTDFLVHVLAAAWDQQKW